jgi:nucleotide-binding universal stress UspA family protein
MNDLSNQVAMRGEAIPLAAALSPDADTMKFYVQALAYRYQAEVLLLRVVDLGSSFGASDADLPVKMYRVFEETCLQNMISGRETNSPAPELCEVEPDPNLLVIGSRGAGDLSRMVLGSTAQEFLYQADIPVFTVGPGVPRPEQPIRFQNIVYATDYSPEAAKACVSAFAFAQDLGAQAYVCHVLPDANGDCDLGEEDLYDKFIGALQALVPDVPPEWTDPECVLDSKYAADQILLVAQRVKASLIVLATRRAQQRLHNSTTGLPFQVIRGSTCPVLSLQG